MDRLITIGQAAKLLGVSITTLRRWEAEGYLHSERTNGKHRRYDVSTLKPEIFRFKSSRRKTIAYARVI